MPKRWATTGELDYTLAIVFDYFEAFEAAQKPPDHGAVENEAITFGTRLTGFAHYVKGDRRNRGAVNPGETLQHILPQGLSGSSGAEVVRSSNTTHRRKEHYRDIDKKKRGLPPPPRQFFLLQDGVSLFPTCSQALCNPEVAWLPAALEARAHRPKA